VDAMSFCFPSFTHIDWRATPAGAVIMHFVCTSIL
jgi:hypothetical protein